MAICTKQSIGATLAVIVVGYKLLFIENKQEFKQYMKIAITRIIGILIPVIMMYIYLIINNALSEFVNYAILGISTFSNKIEYTALFANDKIQIRILSIFMPISIVLMAVILLITNILNKERLDLCWKKPTNSCLAQHCFASLFTLFHASACSAASRVSCCS